MRSTRSSKLGLVSAAMLLAPGMASSQEPPAPVEHLVLRLKQPVFGPLRAGFLEIAGRRLVVGAWHSGSSPMVLLIDRETGEAVADLRDVDPQNVWVSDRTVVAPGLTGEHGRLYDLQSGQPLVDLQGLYGGNGASTLISCDQGRVVRRDHLTGAPTSTVDLGDAFRDLGGFLMTAEGLWVYTRDRRRLVRLNDRGRETARYEVPAADAAAAKTIDIDQLQTPDDGVVVCLGGVTVDAAGSKGTVFRLLDGGRPKDLALRGGRSPLCAVGRLNRDTRTWSFERQRKWLVVLAARADGSLEGGADTFHTVDVKRWRIVAQSPKPPESTVNDRGYMLAGSTIRDLADGKALREVAQGDARWVGLTDQFGLSWDQKARRLEIHRLVPYEMRAVPLPEASSLAVITRRNGDDVVLLQTTGDHTTITRLVPETGVMVSIGEVRGAVNTGEVARGDGRLWVILPEGEEQGAKLHVFGLPAP